MRMGPWDQFNRRSTKGIKCKDLYNNNQGGKNIKPMVEQTIKGRTNSGIQIEICSTMFLYSKEG